MDNKITLSVLAQMLSDRTGRSRKECEDLLRSFFQNIASALAAGEPVKVRGFGTFKISQVDARMSVDVSSGQDYEIPAHNRIVFLPAKELAGAVNAPFEMFETIELSDALTDEELQRAESEEALPESEADVEPEPEPESDSEPETESQPEPESQSEPEPQPAGEPSQEQVPEEVAPDSYELESEEDTPADESGQEELQSSDGRRKFSHGFIWGVVATVVLIAVGFSAYYLIDKDFNARVKAVAGIMVLPSVSETANGEKAKEIALTDEVMAEKATDKIEADLAAPERGTSDLDIGEPSAKAEPSDNSEVPTKPSDQPVYDTITRTTALGTMARKHYGNYHFWPYIYKENEKILGHPDRIRPGTRVVIPPLSKYGVDPKNPDDIAKAKRMDAEIYSRYRNKSK